MEPVIQHFSGPLSVLPTTPHQTAGRASDWLRNIQLSYLLLFLFFLLYSDGIHSGDVPGYLVSFMPIVRETELYQNMANWIPTENQRRMKTNIGNIQWFRWLSWGGVSDKIFSVWLNEVSCIIKKLGLKQMQGLRMRWSWQEPLMYSIVMSDDII